MKDINESWLKENSREYKIEELKKIKKEIIGISDAYKDVFNGPPFYESWDLDSALKEINSYIDDGALILSSKFNNKLVGFLVSINRVPDNQKEYVSILENLKYIEEIGVLNDYRKNGLASEMIRMLLLNYLDSTDKYIMYRTNAMRYFYESGSESFESSVIRIQKEDRIKRLNNEKIIIPEFSMEEKQRFINKYIEVIKNMPQLDVSNSNALFRSIFDNLEFNKINNNYSFQIDPTGEGNDRIFPIIDLSKTLYLKRKE